MASQSAAYVGGLRRLYEDERLASFFDWASEFKNDVSQTTVSRIQAQIESGSDDPRSLALDFCKKMAAEGCGKLVLGRHGKKSRMEWAYTLRSIGAVARGDDDYLEPREGDPDEDESGQPAMVRFEIPLRGASYPKASVELPEGFSDQDVTTLIDFFQDHFTVTAPVARRKTAYRRS